LREKRSKSVRIKVAREAALLLYTQQEKEYKQAKKRAADALMTRALPSNKEIAYEMDRIAEATEGPARKERLVQMRKDALSIMVTLGEFHPRLVGSAWRGTAHRNSDIDIEVFASNHGTVVERLKLSGFHVQKAEWQLLTKGVENEETFHIYLASSSGNAVELVVRDAEKVNAADRCEIYGDLIKGLDIHQLRRVLLMDPAQKFVPVSPNSNLS
jgi:predicted nucleotidyltransferase